MPANTAIIERVRKNVQGTSRYSDIYLAILVVFIVSLIIIPVPLWLLDFLIGLNLTIAITLLMLAIYIPRALAFSSFPSILLFTTLYRLALNITTTRMILLKADAGQIIYTFGEFVVSGNFVVGMVLFLIILVMQFIVITKGAERVAEVAARFTLDAMPGKQMSIDADLRAGSISIEQARSRRSEIEQENKLYGAMDGAMKFVKGDAIAALIITAVNLLAGLAIGILQRGMSLDNAVSTYSILTIGDGLVSQIPALLISMTAGIIVTRVGSDEGSPLGTDIFNQVVKQPKALLIASALVFLFGFIPGFPPLQFIVTAFLIVVVGISYYKGTQTEDDVSEGGARAPATQKKEASKPKPGDEFSMAVPLMIEVPNAVQDFLETAAFNDRLIKLRQALYQDLGVPFPGIRLRYSPNLPDGRYTILLNEVPVSNGFYRAGHVLVKEDKKNLELMNIPFVEDRKFLPDLEATWTPVAAVPSLEKAQIGYLEIPDVFSYHLAFILRRYASEFIGLQETRFLLDRMEEEFPEITREVQRILPIQKITDVLRRLVQEDISVRNLRTISQTLVDWGQKEKEPILLCEYVRGALKRYISYKYSGENNVLPVFLLQPEVEDIIRKGIRQTSSGSYLALEPETARRLVNNIKEEVARVSKGTRKPVLLASLDIRRYLRKLIDLDLYELPVLSHQELTEEINVQPISRISL